MRPPTSELRLNVLSDLNCTPEPRRGRDNAFLQTCSYVTFVSDRPGPEVALERRKERWSGASNAGSRGRRSSAPTSGNPAAFPSPGGESRKWVRPRFVRSAGMGTELFIADVALRT